MLKQKNRIIKVCKYEAGHYIVSRDLKYRHNDLLVKSIIPKEIQQVQ